MRRADIFTFAATFLIVFAVYFTTTAPTIGLVDAGELTTAARTLSIAHPTGYPLYTNLGHLWLMLTPFTAARGMVVFSVLMAALGAGVLSLICARLLRSVIESDSLRGSLSVLLTIGIALSPTAWTSVDFAEVYPLTWLIGALLIFLAYVNTSNVEERSPYLPLMICYVWGLGFGNHLTILWFAPLVLFAVVRYVRQSRRRGYAALWCLALYLLGTSINLYLPIRSARGPLLDWSAPHTIPGLIRHLTGWQYRVWMFKGDWSVFFHKLFGYFGAVPGDIGWALATLAVIGLIVSVKRKSWLIVSVFGVWLLGNLYNANYDIPDISTYFLPFYAPLFIVAAAGFAWILERMESVVAGSRSRGAAAIILACVVPASSVVSAGRSGIQSSNYFAVNFATEVIRTLPTNALVLQANWDIQSPYIYLHNIEGLRPDLVMLDLNLLQRPWYIRQEQRTHPDVFAGLDRQIDAFISEVAPFESGQPYDGPRIESAFVTMLNTMIVNQSSKRPVFIRDTYQTGHAGIAQKMKMIPGGYFLRITDSPTPESVINVDPIVAGLHDRDDRVTYLLHTLAAAAASQGTFAMQIGNTPTVERTLAACRKLDLSDAKDLRDFMQKAETYLASKRGGAQE